MSTIGRAADTVALAGLDGANPLGFLTALGTLVTVHRAGERHAKLSWAHRTTWVPLLDGMSASDPKELSDLIAQGLAGRDVPAKAEEERARTARRFDAAKKAVADKRKEIKKRGLRGAERRAVIEAEVTPLAEEYQTARQEWLRALSLAAPRPELALGQRLDCTPEEYREHADALLARSNRAARDAVDLLAAFGTDACVAARRDQLEPTPFQFITGSGHQFFLATVRELMQQVTPQRVRRTLFETWAYPDEGLSMRWDPLEDRRYALMDRDPTAAGNKPRTEWMANLLAYRALALFPAAPRRSLEVVGWAGKNGDPRFTWPLWIYPASLDTIRSLLTLGELRERRPKRETLHARGVAAAFRARRIKVGSGTNYKLNFTPARAV